MLMRRLFLVGGQVQGVGFRPFVYREALRHHLTGHVGNTSEGVRIEVQGEEAMLDSFSSVLRESAPPLARIVFCESSEMPLCADETLFIIVPSRGKSGHSVLVSPDMGLCSECSADMHDPHNRRYLYPFTNCTNCGPRYTITRSIPYDRATTSMSCFPMCSECAVEYENPLDRRFHAQPNACSVCGPRLWLVEKDNAGNLLEETELSRNDYVSSEASVDALSQRVLRRTAALLREGHIVAIKGVGGFLLAADARNESTVALLRERKHRPHKPFAVMLADVAAARELVELSPREEALLCSPEKPIVLCEPKKGVRLSAKAHLPHSIAPDALRLGIMLPNSPLHVALFAHYTQTCQQGASADVVPALIMTSGNAAGEPLCLGNREALRRLAYAADAFLLHDRDILVRVDDSVLAAGIEENVFFRRARGYVPRPVFLSEQVMPPFGMSFAISGAKKDSLLPCVLGCGAGLKVTPCINRGREAFVGQHIGDMENPATLAFFEETVTHLESLLEIRPTMLACDRHPDFLSSRYANARSQGENIPLVRVQHHVAHAASVLAENNCATPALALVLDGTGLGDDGTIWGGELLWLDMSEARYQRMGSLRPFPLAGGEKAIREPWRLAETLCVLADVRMPENKCSWRTAHEKVLPLLHAALQKNINTPLTSSCGRLFDALAATLGLCLHTTYEGQGAVRLEAAQGREWLAYLRAQEEAGSTAAHAAYAPLIKDIPVIAGECECLDVWHLFSTLAAEYCAGTAVADVARMFHVSLSWAFAAMAARAAHKSNVSQIALSGGVFQNMTMALLTSRFLKAHGLSVLTHKALPTGDGGISLGQAVWAWNTLR